MSTHESEHEFQAEMEERLPELAHLPQELRLLGARVFDNTAYIDDLLRDDDMTVTDRTLLVAELLTESSREIFSQPEGNTEHSANWEMVHPLWSDKATYGYLYHEKTPDWELFDIACTPIVLDTPDEDTMLTMQIEIDKREIQVLIEGDVLDFTRDKKITDGQYAIISHLFASIRELNLQEATHQSHY